LCSDLSAENRSERANCHADPWVKGDKENGQIEPKRLDVLEFGREVALEIVFDDEDAKEIGIAVGAEDGTTRGRAVRQNAAIAVG